jgi:pimeloyl-ACP methyl ester carboxylesterase
MERLVTNVMIYWLTGCVHSASWLYTAARRKGGMALGKGEVVRVPTGFMACGHDLFSAPPDSWLRRAYPSVRRTDLPAAGHFVAWQRPEEFVADLREFFRPFRRA